MYIYYIYKIYKLLHLENNWMQQYAHACVCVCVYVNSVIVVFVVGFLDFRIASCQNWLVTGNNGLSNCALCTD